MNPGDDSTTPPTIRQWNCYLVTSTGRPVWRSKHSAMTHTIRNKECNNKYNKTNYILPRTISHHDHENTTNIRNRLQQSIYRRSFLHWHLAGWQQHSDLSWSCRDYTSSVGLHSWDIHGEKTSILILKGVRAPHVSPYGLQLNMTVVLEELDGYWYDI